MRSRRLRFALAAAAVAAAAACAFAVTAIYPKLLIRLDGDYLRVAVTPHLNFLSGRSLERLKDGASIGFAGQLTITSSPNSLIPEARAVAHFALSYDIWEQKFAAVKMAERPDGRRSVSHLSAEAMESWCIDNLSIERSLIPPDRPFYVQLDLRAEDPRDQAGVVGDSGINLTQLIEIFRAPIRDGQKPFRVVNGPLRLSDLRKAG